MTNTVTIYRCRLNSHNRLAEEKILLLQTGDISQAQKFAEHSWVGGRSLAWRGTEYAMYSEKFDDHELCVLMDSVHDIEIDLASPSSI